MPDDDIQNELSNLPKLVEAWQAGDSSLGSREFAELSDLLRSHRAARSYFLQAMQIDAELRWRIASSRQVDGALAPSPEGTVRPIASIVLNELAFRTDQGFAAVYDCVQHSDALAQLWLRLYPAIRACTLICVPSVSDTDTVVSAICDSLSTQSHDATPPGEFQRIAREVTLEQVSRWLRDHLHTQAKVLLKIVGRCLDSAPELDTVAIYESVEAIVPHTLSTDALRLLCNRYLVEQSPTEMAFASGVPEQKLYAQLAEARHPIWKACVAATNLPKVSLHPRSLASLNRFLDASPTPPEPLQLTPSTDAGLRPLENLSSWLTDNTQNCKCFLTFAILHESLYRQLSLPKLLDESLSRKDEAFHGVVTEVITQLEDVPAAPTPNPVSLPQPAFTAAAAGWFGAIAAALLIAATLALWGTTNPSQLQTNNSVVTQTTPKSLEDHQSEPTPEPELPPQPVVVGTIQSALDLPSGHILGEIGASIVAGQTIELAEGIVQISTVSGSQWILQSPITLVISEDGAVDLKHGRLVGLNSGQAIPLVVRTPSATVVDVGTEFGVGVSDDLETTVAVYQGAVALLDATSDESLPTEDILAIEANRQAVVSSDGSLQMPPEPLLHDRDFIRPDEVQLRKEMQQGSAAAADKVAFFELLRVDGLLAYQGFHASQGEEFVIGFVEPGIRPVGGVAFAANLDGGDTRFSSSRSLLLSNDQSVFLDLDASQHSPWARSGMLDDAGMLGQQPGEIWLFWRSKSELQEGKQFSWVGLSIMHGDQRAADEPLFVGKPSSLETFGTHMYGDDAVRQELDIDPSTPGVQSMPSDSKPHQWIVRIACAGGGEATASVWCDIDPSQVEAVAPHAQQHYDDLHFDRIRVEVSGPGDQGKCAFDQVVFTSSSDALASALSVVSTPSPATRPVGN